MGGAARLEADSVAAVWAVWLRISMVPGRKEPLYHRNRLVQALLEPRLDPRPCAKVSLMLVSEGGEASRSRAEVRGYHRSLQGAADRHRHRRGASSIVQATQSQD